MKRMKIHCCACDKEVYARLTDGQETYPHRQDLKRLPFWKCDTCGNFVGCHHKTKNRAMPLGCIPTIEIKNARRHIHSILDPLWKSGRFRRSDLYSRISDYLGRRYHTAGITNIDEARRIYRYIQSLHEPKGMNHE